MKRAQVMGSWIQQPGVRVGELSRTYSLTRWEDVTGQAALAIPPEPNVSVWQIECGDEVMAGLEADARFAVIWFEDIPVGSNRAMGIQAAGRRRSDIAPIETKRVLRDWLKQKDVPHATAHALCQVDAPSATFEAIALALVTWARVLPKAS